jgi:hypothetical protein
MYSALRTICTAMALSLGFSQKTIFNIPPASMASATGFQLGGCEAIKAFNTSDAILVTQFPFQSLPFSQLLIETPLPLSSLQQPVFNGATDNNH